MAINRPNLLVCSYLMILTSVGATHARTFGDHLVGDANGDCAVDPLDSGYVLARFGCAVGTGNPSCDAADVNGDGSVNPLDDGFVLARFCASANPLPAVAIDEAETLTVKTLVTLTGMTIGATSVEMAGGVELVSAPVVDCAFAVEVDLHPNTVNHLFVTGIVDDGTPGSPAPEPRSASPAPTEPRGWENRSGPAGAPLAAWFDGGPVGGLGVDDHGDRGVTRGCSLGPFTRQELKRFHGIV